jgi:hypothetical protein
MPSSPRKRTGDLVEKPSSTEGLSKTQRPEDEFLQTIDRVATYAKWERLKLLPTDTRRERWRLAFFSEPLDSESLLQVSHEHDDISTTSTEADRVNLRLSQSDCPGPPWCLAKTQPWACISPKTCISCWTCAVDREEKTSNATTHIIQAWQWLREFFP